MIFRYSDYRKFLDHMKSVQTVVPLGRWDGGKAIILRHDVDIDLEAARRLALIEAECDIRSSFFILTTSNMYNPASAVNRGKLRQIADMGFEIGLHFDPAVYGDVSKDRLDEQVDREADILATITGNPVLSLSLHNPATNSFYPTFDGYCNAYSKRIFSDHTYLSDSRMDFRGKDPYEFVRAAIDRPVQVLLHPIHYSENGDAYPDLYCRMLKSHIGEVHREALVNTAYAGQMSCSLLEYLASKGTAR